MEKGTAQKDTIIDITSDSQVNSNFPYRWSPVSLTFNNYFYLFLYLYITRITINNNAPHLKSPKNQNRRAALGRPAIKSTGGGGASARLQAVSLSQFSCIKVMLQYCPSRLSLTLDELCFKTGPSCSKLAMSSVTFR